MKKNLVPILACPVCLSPLELKIQEEENDEVIEGSLKCNKCERLYTIQEKIPRMIPIIPSNYSDFDPFLKNRFNTASFEKLENILKHQDVKEANITYHDLAAEMYDEENAIVYNSYNQSRIDKCLKYFSKMTKHTCLLDIGCGTGNVLKFGKKYYQTALGVDVSINMLKKGSDLGLDVIQADAQFLPFKSETFDTISLFSVLHHIYDYSATFKEIQRTLARGGFVYSDWGPQKMPEIKSNYALLFFGKFFSFLKLIKLFEQISNPDTRICGKIKFREVHPELTHIYRKAEYHEQSDERGLDPDLIKEKLTESGFENIFFRMHIQGKSFEELDITTLQKIELNIKSKLSNKPIDRFLENIQIIAQKR
jgi:ubiquinone/menaquinone biosynthesis C-methylase UbiE/uncharacterized protein YbaR (Trm112 family)